MFSFAIELRNLILFGFLSLFSQGISQSNIYLSETGKVNFVSEAPLEIIRAEANNLRAAINLSDNSFLFVLNNAGFNGFNSPLQQEHFHENYMETKKFPQSSFVGKIIEPLNVIEGTTQQVRAKGVLKIHGVELERIIKANVTFGKNYLKIEADFIVPLEDHQIRIPKIVSRKIATEIQVQMQCELFPANSKQLLQP